MNKGDLIADIAERTGIARADAQRALDAATESIRDALARGGEVSIAGFGKFTVAERGPREGRHPRTGEPMQIAASRNPKFTAAKAFKDAV